MEVTFQNLNMMQAFAIGSACAERQWPVYARASEGKPWGKQIILRSALDDIWDWLLDIHNRPQGIWKPCEEAILEEIEDDAASAAREVAGSFLSLSYAVENNSLGDCFQVLCNGLNIVEAFVYEELLELPTTTENDLFVDENELLQREVRYQNEDLALILGADSLSLIVCDLLERSKGQSILGEHWYQ
jgi:hypothetical protein